MSNEPLEIIKEQLQKAIQYKKCWRCGCQQNTVKAVESYLDKLNEEDRATIEPLLEESKATFVPVEYDCLGCKICFPAVLSNELSAAYPSLDIQDKSCSPANIPVGRRKIWPPYPGNYEVLEEQCPVAICTLNSPKLKQELAGILSRNVSIIGTLNTENLGIERLISNVITNSSIRHLIVCGEDSRQRIGHFPGQSLVSLLQNGMDETNRIVGAQGKRPVLKNLRHEEVAMFRNQIQFTDLIGNEDINVIMDFVNKAGKESNQVPVPRPAIPISYKEPVIAKDSPKLILDPCGYFVIYPDSRTKNVRVEHFQKGGVLNEVVVGNEFNALVATVISLNLVSRLDHAAYLGKELAHAFESLATGIPYVQEKAPGEFGDKSNQEGCSCSTCSSVKESVDD